MNGNSQQGNQEVSILKDAIDGYRKVEFALRCLAAPCEVWVRGMGTVGERHWIITVPCGLLLHFLMSVYIGAQHPRPDEFFWITFYLATTFGYLFFHRIQRARLNHHGYVYHSTYWGDSIFDRPNRPRPGIVRRGLLEMVWTWFFALVFMPLSTGVGITLFFAGMALLVNGFRMNAKEHAITRMLTDAMIDAHSNSQRI